MKWAPAAFKGFQGCAFSILDDLISLFLIVQMAKFEVFVQASALGVKENAVNTGMDRPAPETAAAER